MQEIDVEKTNLGLQAYYKDLEWVKKRKLIGYLMNKTGWSYNQCWNRLTGKTKFSAIELQVVEPVIKSEEWNL